MIAVVQALQVLSGMVWLFVAVILWPAVFRGWVGQASTIDAVYSPSFYVACVMALFTFRWVAWSHSLAGMGGDELVFWAALYIMSGACAVGVIWAHWAVKGR